MFVGFQLWLLIDLVDFLMGLVRYKNLEDKQKNTWSVSNPINNYGVNINIGIMFPSQKQKEKKGI
jgi:hypothetical protein